MNLNNLSKHQKIVITSVVILSVILLLVGLAPTLYQCHSVSGWGVVCQTSPGERTPLAPLLLAYLIAELSIVGVGFTVMMWLSKK